MSAEKIVTETQLEFSFASAALDGVGCRVLRALSRVQNDIDKWERLMAVMEVEYWRFDSFCCDVVDEICRDALHRHWLDPREYESSAYAIVRLCSQHDYWPSQKRQGYQAAEILRALAKHARDLDEIERFELAQALAA